MNDTEPLVGHRSIVFSGERLETPVLLREHLRPGTTYVGPTVIEEDSSTTIVPPRHAVTVDNFGNLLIKRTEG